MLIYLIDINVPAEINEYPSLRFQDIRKKKQCRGRTHGRTDNVETVYPTTKFAVDIKYFNGIRKVIFLFYPILAF